MVSDNIGSVTGGRLQPQERLAYCVYETSHRISDSPSQIVAAPCSSVGLGAGPHAPSASIVKALQKVSKQPDLYMRQTTLLDEEDSPAMYHDLLGLSEWRHGKFDLREIKCLMRQLLEGLQHCHQHLIVHGDIRSSNLLLTKEGELKLGDFGLARPHVKSSQQAHDTNRVMTLWYRPPELLLGSVNYGTAVDIWAAGCILAELMTGKPLFNGESEEDLVDMIFWLCGSPNSMTWSEAVRLPEWEKHRPESILPRNIRYRFRREWDKTAVDLLDKMLTLDPECRVTASAALEHPFFTHSTPLPCQPSDIKLPNRSCLGTNAPHQLTRIPSDPSQPLLPLPVHMSAPHHHEERDNIVPPIHPDEAMQMVSEVAEQADGSLSRPGGGWGEVFGPSVATAPSVTPPATQPAPMDTQAGGHTSAPPRSAGKVNSEDKSPQSAPSGQPIKQENPQPPSSPHAPRRAKSKADHTIGVRKRVKGDKDRAAAATRTSSGNGSGGTAKPVTQQQQDSDDDVIPRSTKRDGSGRRGGPQAPPAAVPPGCKGLDDVHIVPDAGVTPLSRQLLEGCIRRTIKSGAQVTWLIRQGADLRAIGCLRPRGTTTGSPIWQYSCLSFAIDSPTGTPSLVATGANFLIDVPVVTSQWPSRQLQREVINALIDGGADVNGGLGGCMVERPIKVAIRAGNLTAVEALLAGQADLRGIWVMDLPFFPDAAPSATREYEDTLMDIYRRLAQHDSTLATERTAYGENLVNSAARSSTGLFSQLFIDQYLSLITSHRVDIRATDTKLMDTLGMTPLERAALFGSPCVAHWLCRQLTADDVNRGSQPNKPPVAIAADKLDEYQEQEQHEDGQEERRQRWIAEFKTTIGVLLRGGAAPSIARMLTAVEVSRRRRQLVLAEYATLLNELRAAVMSAINAALAPQRNHSMLLAHLLPLTPHHDGAHPHPSPSKMSFGPHEAEAIAWKIGAFLHEPLTAVAAINEYLIGESLLRRRVCAAVGHFVKSAATQTSSNREVVGGTRYEQQGDRRVKVTVPPLQCFALEGVDSRPSHAVHTAGRVGLREVVHKARLDEAAQHGVVGVIKGFNEHLGDQDCEFEWGQLGHLSRTGLLVSHHAAAVKEEPTPTDIGGKDEGSPSVAVTVAPPPASWGEAAALERMRTYRERLTQLHGAESYDECLSVLGEVESLCGHFDADLVIRPLQTSKLGPTLGQHLSKSPNPQLRVVQRRSSRP
ncbi:unnamed protein product [Vitrella brassicaformis CCMP3155]|uniref:Cyclin-dependent kinase 2 homolog n=1 Tax=Vitrella brassicaformis (strain CCMP3155) TaxID=1169540 RepID=A0A0G4FRN9_VITBC|nr:unnamed protein product [Vitrella brassicaformis CCMP3155]|eukprot:CEM17330.1 unnamed protein product [Vitrella brassicaformis CCMP3155]